MDNYQALIIGGGPAGVTTALYLARANIKTAIIENGPGALARAHKIDNYYGITTSGNKLYAAGLEQAKNLGVTILQDEVLSADFFDVFNLTLRNNPDNLQAPVLILATGTKNITLNLPGLSTLEGKGISYCAVCDGFFFRNKKIAVLGNGSYALHEAEYLKHLAASITILTNGEDDSLAKQAGFATKTEPLVKVNGTNKLESISFADNTTDEFDALFLAIGTADSTDLARKLGAKVNGRFIDVNAENATNIPGLFAAGDCTGGLIQISKAVFDGTKAGLAAIKFIRNKNKGVD